MFPNLPLPEGVTKFYKFEGQFDLEGQTDIEVQGHQFLRKFEGKIQNGSKVITFKSNNTST